VARILVTGAGGFIGRALCPVLAVRGHHVVAGLRTAPGFGVPPIAGAAETRILGAIGPRRVWGEELRGVDAVVHLAQRAHRPPAPGALADEPAAAAALASTAAAAGVRRLLYMSSIKAMGEATLPGQAFRADDPARPEDAYGRVKLATEQALREVAATSGLELVILRPPLVYGPGVGGNFRALVRLVGSGLPLPFAALDNRRSLIFIDNLVDLVATALTHPAAAGRVLLAADDAALATPALIGLLAQGQDRIARLFAVPGALIMLLRRLPGLGPPLCRLTLSLQIDDAATRAALAWTPRVAAATALIATARALAGR
jgi:UDP-N-acetyl-alpha-D-quinovosamine dehydrogenase